MFCWFGTHCLGVAEVWKHHRNNKMSGMISCPSILRYEKRPLVIQDTMESSTNGPFSTTMLNYQRVLQRPVGDLQILTLLWMVAKSCTTLDGWNPVNNGISHLSTAAFRNHPQSGPTVPREKKKTNLLFISWVLTSLPWSKIGILSPFLGIPSSWYINLN